jgi:hypothetical protein
MTATFSAVATEENNFISSVTTAAFCKVTFDIINY